MSEEKNGHEAHTKKADNLGIISAIRRPLKVVFLGAGSGFFQALIKDILSIPGADRGEMALVDIDEDKLKLAHRLGEKVIQAMGKDGWAITSSGNRLDVLEGADYVINCIEVSGVSCVKHDNDIPLKYGIDQCIGDTIGPGGLFKAMRTVPTFLEILKDIEQICPNALVLNYTNPMSIMCLAASRTSSVKVIGLCHSVQGSSHILAKFANVPFDELTWRCGGVNHLAWFTELSHNGKDLYPVLKEKAENDKESLEKDPVRLDFMKYCDYFVTESSGHFSEYVPYYRKRQELIDKHCGEKYKGGSGFYAREWPTWRENRDKDRIAILADEKELNLDRSWEYVSFIIEAIETNQPFTAYLTVPNKGLIPNLPQDGVVEIACLCDKRGITPTYFGKLPVQCAALCSSHMYMYDLAAEACIKKSKKLAAQALLLDPLSAAVCSPEEIFKMTEELFEAESEFLPGFE